MAAQGLDLVSQARCAGTLSVAAAAADPTTCGRPDAQVLPCPAWRALLFVLYPGRFTVVCPVRQQQQTLARCPLPHPRQCAPRPEVPPTLRPFEQRQGWQRAGLQAPRTSKKGHSEGTQVALYLSVPGGSYHPYLDEAMEELLLATISIHPAPSTQACVAQLRGLVPCVEADDSGDDDDETASPADKSELRRTIKGLSLKLDDLSTCNDLIAKHGAALQRSLSELDSLKIPCESSEKLKVVNERATLFRITSNAMINACRDFLELAETHSRKWQRALQYEQDQRVHLEETIEQLARQHNSLERAFRSAPGRAAHPTKSFSEGSLLTPKGEDSEEDEDTEYFDAMEDSTSFITVITEAKEDSRKAEGGTTGSVDWTSSDNVLDGASLVPKGPPKVKRRVRIPDKPNYSLNLWSIMKNCIGRELSKIPMPVNFNEPLSMLQRLTEDLEYHHLLDKAAHCTSSVEQMCLVAAFSVSSYSTTVHRIAKPFNPMLGETFELDRLDDMGLRSLCEQVSHHPPSAAHYVFSKHGWSLWQEITISSKFRGKYLSIMPLGAIHLEFQASGNHYVWRKSTSTVHNIIVGKLWIDQTGDIEIVNHKTQDRCQLKFLPYSYFSKDVARKVTGVVSDSQGKAHYVLSGSWDEQMECAKIVQSSPSSPSSDGKQKTVYQTLPAKLLWKKYPLPENAENMYYFSELALTLNEHEEGVAPTDSRLRPDQRLMEKGHWDEANTEKQRLEEKQRLSRRRRLEACSRGCGTEEEKEADVYMPLWFEKRLDPLTGETACMYKGGYWEAKERQDWHMCPFDHSV
ncbi:oxysterol-binding protein 2 [Ursus maritimus]|uniref:Oxysterol-binding protein n=1 Tax=Ursus maritimus TaxID=29073 RepID=A0A8M1F0K9_URSMA|nr:oxysterol-binding protein 2 [Ursus maritimus]